MQFGGDAGAIGFGGSGSVPFSQLWQPFHYGCGGAGFQAGGWVRT
jgi:hypothetical protein